MGRQMILGTGVIGLILVVASCSPQTIQEASVGMVKFKEAVDDDAYVLDVREEWEYTKGHIKGSKLIPFKQLISRMDEVPDERKIYVICRSSHCSQQAVKTLQKFDKLVVNVEGGMREWIDVGYPIEN